MNKETYITKKEDIKNKISQLQKELQQIGDEYISSNSKFKIGSRVKIIVPETKSWSGNIIPESQRIAFVSGYKINWNDEVEVKLTKPKKDGSPSKFEDYLSRGTIEKV